MSIETGDKVRFLNETGEGVVRSVSGNIAYVEIEDGFEIPMVMSELVRVGKAPVKKEDVPKARVERSLSSSVGGEEVIYLALVPEDQSKLLSSPLQLYIINNTSYQLVYSIAINENNKDSGLNLGYIYPNTEKHIGTFNRNEIERWNNLLLQVLFHSKDVFRVKAPMQERVVLKMKDLNNIDKLRQLKGINKHAFLFRLEESRKEENLPELHNLINKYKGDDSLKMVSTFRKSPEKNFNGFSREVEVDLHIEELTDSFTGMSNAEIIAFQMDYFHKTMNIALSSKINRIVFIHGNGNGTLKKQIKDELKNYKGVKVEEGAFSKYGSGSTVVIFQ